MDENTRCRMNFSQTAKGLVQMDVTVEYATPDETATQAAKAIDLYRSICIQKGLKIVEVAP